MDATSSKVKIGTMTLEVSKQAQATFWSWVVGIIFFLLVSVMKEAELVTVLPMFLFMVVAAALSVYVTNCVVLGKCYVYAWFLVALSVLNMLAYIVAFVVALMWGNRKRAVSRKGRKV